jgi:hypothetical protein
MNEDLHARSAAELERLRDLTLRLQQPAKPSPAEVQGALECGFACLISLEAELQRSNGETPALAAEAAALHGALTHLRELSGTQPSSWRTRGFVLPGERLRSAGAVRQTPRPGRGSIARVSPEY